MSPVVTNHFSPVMRQPSPSRTAFVWSTEGSEPAPSSVIAYACRRRPAISGRTYSSTCSGVAYLSTLDGRHGTSQSAFVARPSCSWASIWSNDEYSWPPHAAAC